MQKAGPSQTYCSMMVGPGSSAGSRSPRDIRYDSARHSAPKGSRGVETRSDTRCGTADGSRSQLRSCPSHRPAGINRLVSEHRRTPDTSLQDQWAAVDDYVDSLLIAPDRTLFDALAKSHTAGLPAINVTPAHGKLLHLLARVQGARRILEIGTLGGVSAIWLGRALPQDGRVITIEADPGHADVARANIASAGLSDIVDVRVGRALEVLPEIEREARGPFDLIFIDADKPNTPEYFKWALRLARIGSLIVTDNVVRGGAVRDAASEDPSVQAMRRFLELVASERRVTGTVVQTVGSKGYDGLAIVLVTG